VTVRRIGKANKEGLHLAGCRTSAERSRSRAAAQGHGHGTVVNMNAAIKADRESGRR
jgi:hypothetical protein